MTPAPNRSWVPGAGYQEHPAPPPPFPAGIWLLGPPPPSPAGMFVHPPFPPPPYTPNPPPPAAPPPAAAPLPGRTLHPPLMPGSSYLYPSSHTCLHCIHPLPRPPWEGAPQDLKFEIMKAPTVVSVKVVIEQVLGEEGGDKRSVTEVYEQGEGRWVKGTTWKIGEEKSGKKLEEVGWDSTRGEGGRRPVWVYFERG